MKLCVSLNENTFADYLQAAQKFDFIELRLDLFNFTDQELHQLLKQKSKNIVSYLDAKTQEFTKIEKLKKAVDFGADIIDIDFNTSKQNIKNIIEYANKKKCKTIISYHNFNETPSIKKLNEIIKNTKEFNPDYIKIVCFANTDKDNKTILSLYKNQKNLIAFNMGKLGKITRIKALENKAPFIYVSAEKSKETAEGQISINKTKHIL